jgi:hypothetical protein
MFEAFIEEDGGPDVVGMKFGWRLAADEVGIVAP